MSNPIETHWQVSDAGALDPIITRIENLEKIEHHALVTLDVSVAAWPTCKKVLARVRAR